MGYVACFVMPLLLGIPVVTMDPMTWVRRPELLFETINRHAGTVCYQPNFGYEVMARCAPCELPTMRWWISCSEPISADTSRRFVAHVAADPDSFAPCYAMAENIFALSIRRGLFTRRIEGAEVVSCGKALPHVSLKVVEGEIWARSPTSLRNYLGGTDIRDQDGFYPTGDLGEIVEGEIFVTGRKQDLLIQAGRKFMLSDIDLALNTLRPDVRGRAATIAVYDERLGTQQPVLLIESPAFITRADQQEIAEALKASIGLDQIEVHFVPPRFLTKTSSGKINRKKSGEDWRLHRAAAKGGGAARPNPVAEIQASFRGSDWAQPVRLALDSLSLTVLRTILGDAGLPFDGRMSLADIAAALTAGSADQRATITSEPDTIRIVSLADKRILANVTEAHLAALGERLGAPVTLEHVCLPPATILLSDLVFHDWFQPRLDQAHFAVVDRAAAQLRGASLILTDDVAELYFPPKQVYGVLSHAIERDPRADLLAVRWQRYPQLHHQLPLTVVAGQDIPLGESTRSLKRLAAYLGTPIFRIATIAGFAPFTEGWEFRPLHGTTGQSAGLGVVEPSALIESLAAWAGALSTPLVRKPARGGVPLDMSDLAHYCAHFTPRDAVDRVLSAYDSFCIVGQEASIPYVRHALDRLGKRWVSSLSYAPQALAGIGADFDCILICGAQGNYDLAKPAFGLIRATGRWSTLNVTDPALAELSFSHSLNNMPESGTDWYHPFQLDRRSTKRAYVDVRIKATSEASKNKDADRRERLARRAARAIQAGGQPQGS